jgi:formylglycine-generating enzyme required for sulfatase activity
VGALGLLGIILLIWLLANTDRRPTVAAAGTLENLNQASATFTQAAPLPSTPGAGGLPSNPSPSPDAPTPSPVIQASDTPLPSPTLFRTHVDDAPMIVIPAVEFRMGMRNNVTQWHVDLCNQFSNCNAVDYEDAMPAHTVAVSKFRLDAHEVTNRQYAACVAAQVCPPIQPGALADYLPAAYVNALEYAEYPAVGVTWDSANLYCNWVGKRLPTEAEWERAASGDGSALFPWGDPPAEDVLNLGLMFGDAGPLMNYCDAKCQFAWHDLDNDDGWAGPAPVMSYPPNFMGLYDLAGNAQEWVLDFYDASFYAYSAAFNPVNTTPSACPNRSELNGHVVRGGGWNNGAYHATSRYRLCSEAWQAKAYRGFRCAAP